MHAIDRCRAVAEQLEHRFGDADIVNVVNLVVLAEQLVLCVCLSSHPRSEAEQTNSYYRKNAFHCCNCLF